MKRIIGIVLMLLFCASALAQEAMSTVKYGAFDLDGQPYTCHLDADTCAQIPFSLPGNGRLELLVQCILNGGVSYEVLLMDRNLEEFALDHGMASGESFPGVFNYTYDLTAGDYWVMVRPAYSEDMPCTGDISVTARFTPSAAGDDRQDDSFVVATEFTGEPTLGFLSSMYNDTSFTLPQATQDLQDYYWLQSQGGNYVFNPTSASGDGMYLCTIYDEYFNEIARKYTFDTLFTQELPTGKVYILITGGSALCGDYLLRIQPE